MAVNAPYVNAKLDKHLIKHEDVYDKTLNEHEILLFGDKGDNGLCSDVKEMVNGFKDIKKLGYAVILAIVLDFVSRIMSIAK
jgi:hypothetical protein